MARHDFRFAVDGLELDDEGAALVAARVQEAGLSALAELGHRPGLGFSIGELAIESLRWRGYWTLFGGASERMAEQLAEVEVFDRMNRGFQG